MEFIRPFMLGKRAIAADQATTMDTQPQPSHGSTEPKETPEQATQKKTSALRTVADNVGSVDTAYDDMRSDHADEGKGVYAFKQNAASRSSKHSREHRANARIAGRSEPAERTPVSSYNSSRTQHQTSLNPRPLRRPEQLEQPEQPEQPEQGNFQKGRDSRWGELPDKVDALSAEMRTVLCALQELQQDKHEKGVLRKDLQEAQYKLQNTAAPGSLQQDNHEKIALQKDLQETQDRLQETTVTLQEVRKKWNKASSQLDQFRSHGMGLYQLSDSDLTASAKQLRYEIRTFSLRYFAARLPGQPGHKPARDFWKYVRETTPGSNEYEAYLRSETRGPAVIQSFLWRLLVGEIFEQFCWVPRQLKQSITDVYQSLQPCIGSDELDREIPIAPEVERKFQMWKATTSALILESMKDEEQKKVQKSVGKFSSKLSKLVLDFIGPFVRNTDEGAFNELRHIIENSIALDQEICRQAARVDWIFPPSEDLVPFDPDRMAADTGEVTPQPGQHISMAIAPALKKQGRSTGEAFETEYFLLKMGITCVP